MAQRLHHLDLLRALALLGIFLAHSFARFGFYPVEPSYSLLGESYQWIFAHVLHYKIFLLFAFLFGLSFQLQMQHAAQSGGDCRWRFCWRMLLLLGFSFVHRLFSNGELLFFLAFVGLFLALVCPLRTRWLVLLGLLCLAQPQEWLSHCSWGPDWRSLRDVMQLEPRPDVANAAWWDLARWNWGPGLRLCMVDVLQFGRFNCLVGMGLLGLIMGRHALVLVSTCGRLLPFAFFFGLVYAWLVSPWAVAVPYVCNDTYVGVTFMGFFIPVMLYLLSRFAMPLCLPLQRVGRCTLTCYIMQSVVMAYILCPWGLGLNADLSNQGLLWLSLGIFAVQVLVMHVWLAYFSYGPLEAVWRRLSQIGSK